MGLDDGDEVAIALRDVTTGRGHGAWMPFCSVVSLCEYERKRKRKRRQNKRRKVQYWTRVDEGGSSWTVMDHDGPE